MVRTQIQLTENQAEQAKRAAAQMGISMAEYIRHALDTSLKQQLALEARQRALNVIGCVKSDTGDLSVNHDRYLEEAYSE
ncbi:ribbon-helix-helix domain-containing protein [bacterium]|nr:ribbon-helix-helix domain-containing protein [bacterium]